MPRRPHLLVLGLLVPVVCTAQKPLQSEISADEISVVGDGFRVEWQADRGMQPTAVTLADWAGEFRIDDPQRGVGFAAITIDGKRYRADLAKNPTVETEARTPTDLAFVVRSVPRGGEGEPCPLTLTQRFRVFGEGALFCDLELALPRGAAAVELQDLEVGMSLGTAELSHLQWCWKKTWQGGENLPRTEALRHEGYLRVMGATLSRHDMLTNHVEMFVEDSKPLGGDAEAGMWCEVTPDTEGAKCFSWHLGAGARRARFLVQQPLGHRDGPLSSERQRHRPAHRALAGGQCEPDDLPLGFRHPGHGRLRGERLCAASLLEQGLGQLCPLRRGGSAALGASATSEGQVRAVWPAGRKPASRRSRECIEAPRHRGIYFTSGSCTAVR